ncbi:MAG: ribosomal RNA small subunit methyltransferase A [Opitutales bacterium]|nr:ribosomal RNA small subunit methyltransferase A [Opitutales bacterium]
MNGPAALSPAATRALLERLGHKPRKKLGQNFLIDGNIVRKSMAFAALRLGEPVVEVGPGLGTLTGALVAAGVRVHAVEFDPRLAGYIEEAFGESVDLLCGDAVQHPLGTLRPPHGEPFSVVANLPYAITSPWIEALLSGPLPRRMVLMMQKEAADRLTARPGEGSAGAVSIFLQSAYHGEDRHAVSRNCFYPAPAVDSTLLVLALRKAPLRFPRESRVAVRRVFTQRRKQLGTLVKSDALLGPWWDEARERFRLSPTLRAEAVPLGAWQLLASLDET